MLLTPNISNRNYHSFIWHATFLALASSFMDVDTIMPAMLGAAGGTAFHFGLLTTIMLGGSSFSQLIFAPFINKHASKKVFLLFGINARVIALSGLAFLFLFFDNFSTNTKIYSIFLLVSLFSFSGAFANISYTDIIGKSVLEKSRKSFLSFKQIMSALGVFVSAFAVKLILNSYELPINYAYLFFGASLFLLIASFGFWNIKEIVFTKTKTSINIFQLYGFIKQEIKINKKLKYYLLIINTLGISLSLMPFLVLYAKENFENAQSIIGNILIFKVSGVALAGLILYYYKQKYQYGTIIYMVLIIALLIPIIILNFSNYYVFLLIFFAGGILYSLYTISVSGMLLEISNDKNRAMLTGLTGAGNIIPALFPLFSGWLIGKYGFTPFFIIFISIISISFIFIKKMDCKK